MKNAHHHANGAGFTCAVGAEEAEHLASVNGEREIANGAALCSRRLW